MKVGMKRRYLPWYAMKKNRRTPNTNKKDDKKTKSIESLLLDRTKFEIGTWNVEGKGSPEEIDKILTESAKKLLDVVCLQKANLPAPNTETTNYKWLCSGTYGSAILLKKSSDIVSNTFEKISDDICMAELVGKDNLKINLISCYIPPTTDYKCEEEWAKLKEAIGIISHMTFILAGDFNAQLGKDEMQSNLSCQQRLYHELSNENGKKLSSIIKKCHLMLYLSQKKDTEVFTFNDENLKYQQSYIFVPFSRHTFTSDDNIVWIPKYNHGLLCYQIICRPNPIYNIKLEPESAAKKPPTHFATWNIQSATPTKIDTILNELGLPIICIQELFLTSDEDIQTDNYTWFCTKKLWAKNVGILIKKSPDLVVSTFEPLSQYLCVATILYYEKPFTVMSFQLPAVTDSQHEQAVTQAKEHINSIPENSVIFLGGDFSSVMNTEGPICNSDDFVLKLANESKLDVVVQRNLKMSTIFNQITETGKCRTNYVLLSQNAFKSLKTFVNVRWIPFFEYGVFSVTAKEKVEIKKKFDFDVINALDKPSIEVHMIRENGVTNKNVVYKYMSKELEQDDSANLVSAEDREKFKTTPPSAQDLSRLLKDFVLIHGASRKSNLILTHFGILTKSLIDCKIGGFSVEVMTAPGETGRSICRIKWNDILLAEEIGLSRDRYQNLLRKASQSVIAKLSQTCYTVKAKKNFFNKGCKPIMMGDPELNATFKIVEKKSLPTMEEVYKRIDEFISEDTDDELVFGNDFSRKIMFDIAEYVYNNGLADFRFLKSRFEDPKPDLLAVFRKRSPQYLRDMLIKEPKNIRYFLIPPCGLGVNVVEFNTNIISQVFKEENQKWIKYQKPEQTRQVKKPTPKKKEQPKGSSSVNNKGSQKNVRSQPPGRTKKSSVNPRSQQRLRTQNLGRTSTSTRQLYSQERPLPLLSGRSNYMDRTSTYERNRHSEQLGGRKRDYDMMNSTWNDSYHSDRYYERNSRDRGYVVDLNHSQQNQSDYYKNDSYFDSNGKKPDYDLDRNGSYGSSQFYEPGLFNKRQRLDDVRDSSGFIVERPDWSNIRPLLIVWPITPRSQLEERPEAVLSDNFSIQYKTGTMNNQSVTAVFVTLTQFNGFGMTYCIAKGSNMRNAARDALELLLKHCTVIKPKPSFLCGGRTPNFLRYKIPCQLYPRTYLIMDRAETGPLSTRVIDNLVGRFLDSCEEEMYFDKDSYTLDEKLAVIEQVPKLAQQKLLVRHLGDFPKMFDRYVCVYKPKPKHQLLEDVLKMRGQHPRYEMTVNRLPPELDNLY